MTDFGIHAFDLAKHLAKDDWNPAEAEHAALAYARGGIPLMVTECWEDGCKYSQAMCLDVISWHQDLEHQEALKDPNSGESFWAKKDAEREAHEGC